MAYLRAQDVLSGKEGKATAIIDGSVEDLFFVRSLEATFEKNKAEVNALGYRGTQHKSTGWSGSGSMTLWYVSSIFRKIALRYAKNGVDTNMTITVENDDPTSTVGKQTIVLYNVNLDSMLLTQLDADSDTLEEDVDFTFDGFDILDEFNRPIV